MSRVIIFIYFMDSVGNYFSNDPLEGSIRERKVYEIKGNNGYFSLCPYLSGDPSYNSEITLKLTNY